MTHLFRARSLPLNHPLSSSSSMLINPAWKQTVWGSEKLKIRRGQASVRGWRRPRQAQRPCAKGFSSLRLGPHIQWSRWRLRKCQLCLSAWALASLESGPYCWDFHLSSALFHQMWVYLTLKVQALTTLYVQQTQKEWPTHPPVSPRNSQFNRDLEGETWYNWHLHIILQSSVWHVISLRVKSMCWSEKVETIQVWGTRTWRPLPHCGKDLWVRSEFESTKENINRD